MKLSALAVAVLFSANAWAGLGKINVRSYLGETFRAEINLTDVNAAELSSARVGLAGMDTFRDLNVDYSGILSSLKFSVEPSGRGAIVRVSSSAPINEPYLRFVVEARTSSGRSVREYTVLLDPIDYQVSNKPSFVQSLPKAAPSLASQYRDNVAREGAAAARRASADSLYVAPGATLNTLAARVRPQGATLEQTMAALVKNNPSAFIAGDPNRIKAAVNLKVPPAAKIRAIAASEARNLLAPASALAANAMPPAVQASPEPPPAAAPKPAATAPQAAQPVKGGEVLKLMAPETSAPTDEKLSEVEQQVASREQALKDAEKRIATLEAQIKALQNSHEVAKPVAGSAAKAGDAAAGSSWVDSLVDNLPLVGGGAAVALLAALGVVVARRRRQAPSLSSALKLSSGNAGAVLGGGASSNINLQGGASAIGSGHSFMANFTQSVGAIDTAEVDPIAEAEVYIAYGRDAQAEEILKDALSRDPSRHEVRLKLMEIHAARQDKEGFESLARELYAAFDGKGPHWAKAAAMGAVLDPGNPLYQLLDSAPGASAPTVAPATAIDLDHELFGQSPAPTSSSVPTESVAAPREPEKAPSAPVTQSVPTENDDPLRAALFAEAVSSGAPEETSPGNMLDFDLDAAFDLSAKKPAADAAQDDPATSAAIQENLLDFDFNLDSMLNEPSGKAGLQGKSDAAPDLGLEEAGSAGFDALYEGMLGVESAPEAASLEGLSVNDDPLSTKLDLAKVYLDMGDKDGAKEVLEDLLSEAQGGLKAEAEQLLAKIGA